MATLCLVTPRDLDLFAALERCPLTVRQLLKVSTAFKSPFTSERRVQERLQRLCAVGRLRRWHYATAGPGALCYFTLTSDSYRLLHGPEIAVPNRGLFASVGVARQRHTHALADFLVHLFACASHDRVTIEQFHRENTLTLQVSEQRLLPDCAFELTGPDGGPFRFFVEIDAGTESIRSQASLDTWQRKIAFYERYQDSRLERFRVLAVTTGGAQRLANILECARGLSHNPRRSLVYGISLANFLGSDEALTAPRFRDHQDRAVALLPPAAVAASAALYPRLASAGAAPARVVASAPCLEPLPQV